jgi:hypothetical protein
VDLASMSGIERATGVDGAPQEWTLLGTGIEALVVQFFEADPEFGVSVEGPAAGD